MEEAWVPGSGHRAKPPKLHRMLMWGRRKLLLCKGTKIRGMIGCLSTSDLFRLMCFPKERGHEDHMKFCVWRGFVKYECLHFQFRDRGFGHRFSTTNIWVPRTFLLGSLSLHTNDEENCYLVSMYDVADTGWGAFCFHMPAFILFSFVIWFK